MIRWLRGIAIGVVLLAFIAVGVGVGLLLVENGSGNSAWVPIEVHPWLHRVLGESKEAWLPALLAGWLIAAFSLTGLLVWSSFYVWRRRQYETLIRQLERELIHLRNLPFEDPAPFEDLSEAPSSRARSVMLAAEKAEQGLLLADGAPMREER